MDDSIESRVLIREFDEHRDVKLVEKLERNCENIGTKKGVSMFTNTIGDPLSRIRFYPLHVTLVGVTNYNICFLFFSPYMIYLSKVYDKNLS